MIMLDSEIWVDGQYLDEPHCIDLPRLHVEGWYEIFTCGCGVGGCAGIVDGIHVTHHDGLIRWYFRRPQSARRLIDPYLSEWQKTDWPPVHGFTVRALLSIDPTRPYYDLRKGE